MPPTAEPGGDPNGVPARALDLEINPSTYQWSVRLFSIFKKLLQVNLALHQDQDQIQTGDIFLFNHFARFETFIPQYLIHQETGALCRSVASSEFFNQGDAFSSYLLRVGAVPNDLPHLLPFLAAEILRGRKVIVFPEGGMVKDRRVLDPRGEFSVYSRAEQERRKHHTGAAVLALVLDAFKGEILRALAAGHTRLVERRAEALGLAGGAELVAACRRPTTIVPANITFYPIRVGDNLLSKGAELLSKGLSPRVTEELLVEGNILFKDTDMDIRLGAPLTPGRHWSWWERKLLARVAPRCGSLADFFTLGAERRRWDERLLARRMRGKIFRIRDQYMRRVYAVVTVNLSHLASCLIRRLVERGKTHIARPLFHTALYLAVKQVQREPDIHLHRGLRDPDAYGGLPDGRCAGLQQFLSAKASMELLQVTEGAIRFQPKLLEGHGFDEIRLENLIAVYANEVEPLAVVSRCVGDAMTQAPRLDAASRARLRFDDELLSFAWDRRQFSKARHRELNEQETASEGGAPFLLAPENGNGVGVVLVHGFLASPAEVRGLGERLARRGYAVIGVRLKGHGTSPWDLRERSWHDWLACVRRGLAIMAGLRPRVCLVGFSTGGALALHLAAARPEKVIGVVPVSVPIKFRNRAMMFVPVVHGANRLVRRLSSLEGVMPFRASESEHPHINYRHMPVRGLYELRRMADELVQRLGSVVCPVLVIQGSDDPVVDATSAERVRDGVSSERVELVMVPAQRHGILYEDIGGTQETVIRFLESLAR